MDRRAIALKALLAHPDTKLIAGANHRDNFTLWAAHTVWDAIIGTFEHLDKSDNATCDEYNQIVNDATVKDFHNGRDYSYTWATKSPLVISICHEVYKNLNPKQLPTSYQDPLPRKM